MIPGMIAAAGSGATAGGGGGGGGTGGGGGGSAQVDFVSRSAYHSEVTPTDATATWQTTAAGADTSSNEAARTWLLSGVAADYELMVTVESGALTSGTAGVWQSMNATLTYTKTRTTNIAGQSDVQMSCYVRRASDAVVIAAFFVTITAEVLP